MKDKRRFRILISVSLLVPMLILILGIAMNFHIWHVLFAFTAASVVLPITAYFLYARITGKGQRKEDDAEDYPGSEDNRIKRNVFLFIGLSSLILIPILIIAFFLAGTGSVAVTMDDERLHVDAPMVDRTISYDDIISVELRYDFDPGTRVGGFGGNYISSGNFRNSEFGTYTLAIYHDVRAYIVINDGHRILVFNQNSVDRTVEIFNELKVRTGQ
ncbi:MAG: PH domain-containing protein [Methanomassiliicoccaceae archaeon]|nr:PH domain-containing protein [Methanomassiliicoccaceae archaeon]